MSSSASLSTSEGGLILLSNGDGEYDRHEEVFRLVYQSYCIRHDLPWREKRIVKLQTVFRCDQFGAKGMTFSI